MVRPLRVLGAVAAVACGAGGFVLACRGGGAGTAPAPLCAALVGPTVVRTYQPKLFSAGADPAPDPECAEVLNPERGFFVFRDLHGTLELGDVRAHGATLIYAKGLLSAYRDRDLDTSVLVDYQQSLAAVRRAGLKALPRFYYADAEGQPEPPPIARALGHIRQLTPLLQENADVIAALHAGFIGTWGEWHGPVPVTPEQRKSLLDGLLAALPPGRMVLVRRPSFKRAAYGGPIAPGEAHDGSPVARVGQLDDCFLASADDAGTYREPNEEAYAIDDGRFTAVGGETCAANPPRSDCPSALTELARHHWSFLNTDYHPEVIARWKQQGCYPTIACRLGYRFVVRGHQSTEQVHPGGHLDVRLDLVNDGYAAPYNPRPVLLALVSLSAPSAGPGDIVLLPTGSDARAWAPGANTVCLSAPLSADLAAGRYRLALALPDPAPALARDPRYAIRLVGGATWDAARGVNTLDADVIVTR